MTIEKYEVAENAYAQTGGKFHVRALGGGLTQFESQAIGGFETHGDAQDYCDYLNLKLEAAHV